MVALFLYRTGIKQNIHPSWDFGRVILSLGSVYRDTFTNLYCYLMKNFYMIWSMGRLVWSMAIIIVYTSGVYSQSHPGNVVLSTQTQVNNFKQGGGDNWTGVDGDLIINATGTITNLSTLSDIASITGELKFINFNTDDNFSNPLGSLSSLTSVGSLTIGEVGNPNTFKPGFFGSANLSTSTLTTIGGDLTIENNSNLFDITFSNLNPIGGSFIIADNPFLNTITASMLTSVGGDVIILRNALINLTGIGSVTAIAGNLQIRQNAKLTQLGGFGSSSNIVVDTLWIANNTALTTLASLKVTVNGALIINRNNNVTDVSTDITLRTSADDSNPLETVSITNNRNLSTLFPVFDQGGVVVTKNFRIKNNAAITDIGQQIIFTIDSIVISNNANLTEIGNYQFQTSINGDLIIENNPELLGTGSLSNLSQVTGQIRIHNNDALTPTSYELTSESFVSGLTGLQSVTSAGAVHITENDGLLNIGDINPGLVINDSLTIASNLNLADCTTLPCQVTVRGGTVNTLNPAVAIFGNTGDCADKDALRNDTDLDGRACIVAARALPIELLAFSGRLADDHVALTWETATETDNSHFFVERSTNGFTFTAIGRVEGAGSSTEAIRYDYPDYDYPAGRIYYRLRQVDFDGTESVSETVTIISEEAVTGLQTYPNPVTAGTPVEIAMGKVWAMGQISVDVFTADGRRAFSLSHPAGDRITVPTTGLSTGLHLLRISNGTRSETQRLLVR